MGLIEAQRSTLCLVVAHMLLGGDGLPTLSIPTKAFLDEEGLAELEKEMNPPAPVKDVVAKKKDAARFEELIERCRFHEEKLEILLRLIDNESLKPEDLEPVKDQLDFLLAAHGREFGLG